MRFFTLLLLLLSIQTFAQKKILIQSIRINNNYDEVSTNPFNKPENETAFLNALEKGLTEKFGESTFKYLGYKRIIVSDRAIAKNPQHLVNAYQDLYRAKRETNFKEYDVLVDVTVDIDDYFKGRQDNLQITSKVKATDNSKKKLFKNKGPLAVAITPIPFTTDQFNEKQTKIYEGFPLDEEKLMAALTSGVQKAVVQNKAEEEITVARKEYNEYQNFIDQAVSYRITARNDHAQFAAKTKIFNLLTFAKYRPVFVKRQGDNRDIFMHMRERRITDINYTIGSSAIIGASKEHKFFVLKSELSPKQKETYFLHTIATDIKALKVLDFNNDLKMKLQNENHEEVGEFKFKLQESNSNSVVRYAHSLGRIYHPWSVLEGKLNGKTFNMSTNPYTLNAVEIKLDGELVGLITHAAATKKYIRKRKNQLPYFVYFRPETSEKNQQLLLQTFQAFHLAQVLQDGRDIKRNMLPTAMR